MCDYVCETIYIEITNIRASVFRNINHCRWCAQKKTKTATMPQNDALLKAVEKLSDKIECFHTDFKQSIYYLINALNCNHEAENAENPAPPSQMDLFPTQRATRASVGVHRGADREHFKFAGDEK